MSDFVVIAWSKDNCVPVRPRRHRDGGDLDSPVMGYGNRQVDTSNFCWGYAKARPPLRAAAVTTMLASPARSRVLTRCIETPLA